MSRPPMAGITGGSDGRAGRPGGNAAREDAPAPPAAGELFAWLVVSWAGIALLIGSVLLWSGAGINGVPVLLGLAVALGLGYRLAGDVRTWGRAVAGLVAATLVGAAGLGWLYDFSGDGQEYHLPAILALADGWNPYYQTHLDDWSPAFAESITSAVFIDHYAKGAWILAASSFRATGILEAAKLWNLLYLLAAFCACLATLRREGFPKRLAIGLALAASLNPVSLYQAASFYVDGQLAAMYCLALLYGFELLRRPSAAKLLIAGLAFVILANLKFTGLVYGVIMASTLAGFAWLWGSKAAARHYALGMALAFALGVGGMGYQPYVTNALERGNPFYPAIGLEDQRNIQWASAPREFLERNRVEKLVRSLFARSGSAAEMPRWKVPLELERIEIYSFFTTDTRYGGFGPWFGSVLLLLLALLPFVPRARDYWVEACLAATLLLTVLPNPEAWWARLAPQVWLLGIVGVAVLCRQQVDWMRRAGLALLALAAANLALVAAANLGRAIEKNAAFREQLAVLGNRGSGEVAVEVPPRFRVAVERRLREREVDFVRVERVACGNPMEFSFPLSTRSRACPVTDR